MSREFRRVFRFAFCNSALRVLVLCIVIVGATGCQNMSADIGVITSWQYPVRRSVSARVDEDGIKVAVQLELKGCDGQRVPVQIWSENEHGEYKFLAESMITPKGDDTGWKDVELFVPLSRFAGLEPSKTFYIYARSSDTSKGYIGQRSFSYPQPWRPEPDLIWSWQQYGDDVDSGFQVTMRLDQRGYSGQHLDTFIVLEYPNGDVVRGADGSEMVLTGQTLNSDGDSGYWENLVSNIKYNSVSHLWPMQEVFVRPVIKLQDGKYVFGGVYFKMWAGGAFDSISKQFNSARDELRQEIKNTEDKLNAVEKDSK
jgi:hypothetical protein